MIHGNLTFCLTFAFFSEGQGRWNGYLSFLSSTHIFHPNVKALDDLSNAVHEPLRVAVLI